MEEGSLRGRLVGTLVIGVFALLLMSTYIGRLSSAERAQATASATLRPSPTALTADMLHAALVARPSDPTVAVGATTTIDVAFKNTGTATWTKGGQSELHLGIPNEDAALAKAGMAVSWLADTRPAIQTEASVEPGATATFSFGIKGVKAGTYKLALRPVVDGIAWLDDPNLVLTITVK